MTTFIQSSILQSISYPKCPKPKDDDNEVDDISEEHECIDISGSPVLSMQNTPEETLSWPVNSLNAAKKKKRKWQKLNHCIGEKTADVHSLFYKLHL